MMESRLLRALQRGGCAVQSGEGTWRIYRQVDIRGRAIGETPGEHVEPLRASGNLKRLGSGVPERLVWQGPVPACDQPACSPARLAQRDPGSSSVYQSLLARQLKRCTDGSERKRLATAALTFRKDIEAGRGSVSSGGMNWGSIAAGTRVEGGRPSAGHSGARFDAERRLREVLGCFPAPESQRFLFLLIVDESSRRHVANCMGYRPSTVDKLAMSLLRRLADAYDLSSRRPGQV